MGSNRNEPAHGLQHSGSIHSSRGAGVCQHLSDSTWGPQQRSHHSKSQAD